MTIPIDQYVLIPIAAAVGFALAGMAVNWRRVVILVVISYAALILAHQHNKLITTFLVNNLKSSSFTLQQYNAIAFIGTLVVAFVGLHVLFQVMWKPNWSHLQGEGCTNTFLRGFVMASAGWLLGTLIFFAVLTVPGGQMGLQIARIQPLYLRDLITGGATLGSSLADIWIPQNEPVISRSWMPR